MTNAFAAWSWDARNRRSTEPTDRATFTAQLRLALFEAGGDVMARGKLRPAQASLSSWPSPVYSRVRLASSPPASVARSAAGAAAAGTSHDVKRLRELAKYQDMGVVAQVKCTECKHKTSTYCVQCSVGDEHRPHGLHDCCVRDHMKRLRSESE